MKFIDKPNKKKLIIKIVKNLLRNYLSFSLLFHDSTLIL